MVLNGYKKLSTSASHVTLSNEVHSSGGIFCRDSCPLSKKFKCGLAILIVTIFIVTVCLQSYSPPISKASSVSISVGEDTAHDRVGKIRYKHTQRRLPNVLIIGARKAGTRALLTFLNLHPQIQAAKNEIHFFDDDDTYEEGLEWYRKKMPYSFADQITMEKSPAYFVDERVPERVYHMNSTIKLLLIVRDPVERSISDYVQISSNKVDKDRPYPTFEELAMTEDGEVDRTYNAIRRSQYAKHMTKWLKWFPLEQFHIISGEGLVENPVPHIKKIEEFLGLEHRITDENFYFNETRGFYCIRNETMEKCLNPSKGRPHPNVRPEVMQKLRHYFRPWNDKFYKMVHKNFGWL